MNERMSDRVRQVGDGIILAFPSETAHVAGEDIETVKLYFFRVGSVARFFRHYESLPDIASGNTSPTSGYDYLGSTGMGSGDDIFRLGTDDFHLMHFGTGTTHPNLQVFQTVSPKANGGPAIDRTGTDEDITPGTDDRGWWSNALFGSASTYDPPAFTERVSFRNDKAGQFLQWAFYADGVSLTGADTDLYFSGGGYKVQPVTNRQTQQTMLQMAIERPQFPEIDTILHQVGGVSSYTLGSEEPDNWNDSFTQTFDVNQLSNSQRTAAVR